MHKLAIIGYGGMGEWHSVYLKDWLKDMIAVAGVVDIRKERTDRAIENGLKVYPSFESVLDDPEVEIVLLALPNDLHKPYAIKAMRGGKNVIIEKPATLNAADFEDLMQVQKETGKVLTVHQNRRWDRDFLMVKEIYNNKQIGNVYMLESRVQGSRQVLNGWRGAKINGGGMVYDWGVHLIDQYLNMIDSPVTEVYAQLFGIYTDEVDDNFKAMLRFENGVSALVEVSMNCFILHPRWHVCGEVGTMVIDDWSCNGRIMRLSDKEELKWDEKIVYTAAGPTRSMAPRPIETMEELPLPQVNDQLRFYIELCEHLDGKCELPVKPESVLRVLKVMDAIFESDKNGQSVKCNI
ncbi:MAG: Gfo/Idh/MocA family oxidoreductase [Clostridia bacterium]|nr:Gfo/Idh/MocA family oxidoreductase [Clostridia bacterium]